MAQRNWIQFLAARNVIRVLLGVPLCSVTLKVVMPRAEKASHADEATAVGRFMVTGFP